MKLAQFAPIKPSNTKPNPSTNTTNTARSGPWTKEEITALLTRSDKAVGRAILAIYKFQTQTEQAIGHTTDHNGVGFNGVDAEILSSFAQFYQRSGFLTPKQLVLGRRKIMKYAGQLAKIANSKQEV